MIAQQRSIELEFIERKRRANTVSGTNGPVRLGGGNLASLGLTPRELAVLVRGGNSLSARHGHLTLFLLLRRLLT